MKTRKTVKILLGLGISLLATNLVFGQNSPNARGQNNDGTNPNYRLSIRDRIEITVFDEPDLANAMGIDASGEIKLPLIGVFQVAGMTVRDVEKMLEEQYVEQKFLRNPIVNIDVLDYSPKEISVLGPGIASSGQIPFPPEIERIDIVEIISMAGGFAPLAKKKAVRITRDLPNGSVLKLEVNVEDMIEGRKNNKNVETVYIYPGDLIFVDEVLF